MPDKDDFLSEAWTDYLENALKNYHDFCMQEVPLNAKEFIAYHNACKAVLGHILLIKKLISPRSQENQGSNLLKLLEQARKETQEDDEHDVFD